MYGFQSLHLIGLKLIGRNSMCIYNERSDKVIRSAFFGRRLYQCFLEGDYIGEKLLYKMGLRMCVLVLVMMMVLAWELSVGRGGRSLTCEVCSCSSAFYADCSGLGLTVLPDASDLRSGATIDARGNPLDAALMDVWARRYGSVVSVVDVRGSGFFPSSPGRPRFVTDAVASTTREDDVGTVTAAGSDSSDKPLSPWVTSLVFYLLGAGGSCLGFVWLYRKVSSHWDGVRALQRDVENLRELVGGLEAAAAEQALYPAPARPARRGRRPPVAPSARAPRDDPPQPPRSSVSFFSSPHKKRLYFFTVIAFFCNLYILFFTNLSMYCNMV